MSPLSLRRYRAERLLREEFQGLRGRVLASVRGRLQASGASLDQGDLEACYAQAWQGLYAAMLEGQEIANPAGWLVLVTFRRAIEELRAQGRAHPGASTWTQGHSRPRGDIAPETETASAPERDLAAELDDRMHLQQLFEGLRGRLHGREREAATLCYLQGLSRAEAASRMGVSESRMRKLMEGRGPGRPGVAGKVGALVNSIRDGNWCEEQGSLMRALAYGMLDPQGERYQLALMHHGQCPACRAYVVSLRGLAVALPPVFLPWGLSAAVLVRVGHGAHAGGGVAGGGLGGGQAVGGASGGAGSAGGLQAGRAIGGAVSASASGAAGVGGAAGGGWLIGAGPLGAKLAVGCLLALGVGAGCVALEGGHHVPVAHHRRDLAARSDRRRAGSEPTLAAAQLSELAAGVSASLSRTSGSAAQLTPATQASREFGPEQAVADAGSAGAAPRAVAASRTGSSRSASSNSGPSAASGSGSSSGSSSSSASGSAGRSSSSTSAPAALGAPSATASTSDSAAAEREFSPG